MMYFDKDILLHVLHTQALKGNFWVDHDYRWLELANADQLWTEHF